MFITTGFDNRDGIVFREYGKLSNGVEGKLIQHNREKLHYIITKDGDVYNTETEKKLTKYVTKLHRRKGLSYPYVNLYLNDPSHYLTQMIHRLLGLAYIPNPEHKETINHIDGDKNNYSLDNLEWNTYAENNRHAIRTGLKLPTKGREGSSCVLVKHDEETATKVCEMLQDGIPPRVISCRLHVGYDFVIKIRRGQTWTYISKDYIFPFMKESSDMYNLHQVYALQEAIRNSNGETYRELLDKVGLEYNENTRKMAGRLKRAMQNGNDLITLRDMSKNEIYLSRVKRDTKNEFYSS